MPSLVRALAAFGVVLVTMLSTSSRDAVAQTSATGCTIVKQSPGAVRAGEKTVVYASCPSIDVKTTEFYWKIVVTDSKGTKEYKYPGGAGLNSFTLNPMGSGTYEIQVAYGPSTGPFKNADALSLTAAPAAPAAPPVVAKPRPARPPAQVAFLDQVTFTPASFQLKPGERATVTATKPNIGDPHIQWSIPGVKGAAVDKWTMAFTLRKPGNYVLDAVVTDGNNSVNTRRWALPIAVVADALDVRVQGRLNLQQNESAPVVVTPRNGVAPYHLTVSVAGGRSGSRDFDRQTQFLVPTSTPGDKTITIAVVDAKGSTFSKTYPFKVAGAAAPPPNGTNPFEGSYKATVIGPNPPNKNTYWGHVVGYNSDGTMVISLYAYQDNYHVTLKRGTLTMESGNGSKASGTGSISGSGGIGTSITMQWTLTGGDGKPTPYTWVLTKYNNVDYGGPQPGFSR